MTRIKMGDDKATVTLFNGINVPKKEGEILTFRQTYPHHLMTDFERFVGHENFGYYMFMVFAVKVIRQCLFTGTVPDASLVLRLLGERQGEDDLNQVVRLIQSKCILPRNDKTLFIFNVHYVPRNKFTKIDSLIDESIAILRIEFKRCMNLYCDSSRSLTNAVRNVSKAKKAKGSPRGKKGKYGDAIAVKYSKKQTDILTGWMIDHREHPFPTSAEMNNLATATELTYSQIVNWTTNVRKRNLKATVEKGKKPHHFLDFLFLADSRDKNESQGLLNRKKRSKQRARSSNRKRTSSFKLPTNNNYSGSYEAQTPSLNTPTSMQTLTDTKSMNDPQFPTFHLSMSGSTPSIHPGVMIPKVTPPRMHPISTLPKLDSSYEFPCPELPPSSIAFVGWPPLGDPIMDDKAMICEITKDGLVSTPKRRGSEDDISVDLEDCQLMEKLSNVFTEREDRDRGFTLIENIDCRPFDLGELNRIVDPEDMKDDLGDADVMDLLGEEFVSDVEIEV